jgi:hypothetical protein
MEKFIFAAVAALLPAVPACAQSGGAYAPSPTISSLAADTVVGATSAGTPAALPMPSCGSASNALTWTSGAGFGCNTLSSGTGQTVSSLTVTNANAQNALLANGAWWSNPVVYFKPVATGQQMAIDVMPNGATAQTTWIDICSTDITQSVTNFECLALKKQANGSAIVSASASGTGVVQNLNLQYYGGNVGIGAGVAPQSRLDVAGGLAVGSYGGANAAPANGAIISGQVGINTASPLAALKLDVNGVIGSGYLNGNGEVRAWGSAQVPNNYVGLKSQASSPFSYGVYVGQASGYMLFYDGGVGNTVLNSPHGSNLPIILTIKGVEFARLTTTGLGLGGNASPAYPLDVMGAANATSYRVGGTAGVSCAAGAANISTLVVTNGIVTHC